MIVNGGTATNRIPL